MKRQTFIRIIIQFVMVFTRDNRKTRDAGIVFNPSSMVIQSERHLIAYAVIIIDGELNKGPENFCRIHHEGMASAFITVDKGTDLILRPVVRHINKTAVNLNKSDKCIMVFKRISIKSWPMGVIGVLNKVSHEHPISRDRESKLGGRRNHSVVLSPIDKGKAWIGCCSERADSAHRIGASSTHFAALLRVGKNGNATVSLGTEEVKDQASLIVLIQFQMVVACDDREASGANVILNLFKVVIQPERDLLA